MSHMLFDYIYDLDLPDLGYNRMAWKVESFGQPADCKQKVRYYAMLYKHGELLDGGVSHTVSPQAVAS